MRGAVLLDHMGDNGRGHWLRMDRRKHGVGRYGEKAQKFVLVLGRRALLATLMRPMKPSPRRCPRARHSRPCSATGANASSKSEAAVVDPIRAMRRRGESYSEAILRLTGRSA
jgi:hypothetical protein